jgi:hypothetical protein
MPHCHCDTRTAVNHTAVNHTAVNHTAVNHTAGQQLHVAVDEEDEDYMYSFTHLAFSA